MSFRPLEISMAFVCSPHPVYVHHATCDQALFTGRLVSLWPRPCARKCNENLTFGLASYDMYLLQMTDVSLFARLLPLVLLWCRVLFASSFFRLEKNGTLPHGLA